MNKNYWLIGIILLIGIIASEGVAALYCYQESANINNQTGIDGSCGLNYSGSYVVNPSSSGWYDVNGYRYYDGDWSSFTSIVAFPALGEIFINYTKPTNSYISPSLWSIGYYGGVSNISIPTSCLDYNSTKISFKVESRRSTPTNSMHYCFNGSWALLFTSSSDLNFGSYIYEDAMIWNISEPTINFSGGTETNNTYLTRNNTFINITFNYPTLIQINLYNSSNVLINYSSVNVNSSNSSYSYNFTNLARGLYYFNATACNGVICNNTETRMINIVNTFSNNSYNISFPYSNNYYTNNSLLIYGFNTTDQYYNYTKYNVTGITNTSYSVIKYLNNTVVIDTSGNDYNGTPIGNPVINRSYGKYGMGIGLNGSQNILINSLSVTEITNNFSVSMWVNSYATTSEYNLFSHISSNLDRFGITIKSGSVRTGFFNNTVSSWVINKSGVINQNEFTHIIVTWDGSNLLLYLNSINQTTNNLISYACGAAGTTYIGSCSTLRYFNGSIDNVRIYNRSLSSTEISNIYNNERSTPLIDNGLALSYDFENAAGYRLPDGKYYYALTIYDLAGNSQYYDPNITIDTIYPTIIFNSTTPTNGSIFTNNATINITVNINDTNLAYVNTTLYNSTGGIVASNNTNTNLSKINIIIQNDGYYYFNSTTCDLAGNCNTTETRQILVNYWKYYTANVINQNSVQLYYNITMNGTISDYNITNGYGAVTIKIEPDIYNISITDGTYRSNITNYNLTSDTSHTYYLPKYRLNIYNAFTSLPITDNVTIQDIANGVNYSTTTGFFIYNPVNGNVSLIINRTTYIGTVVQQIINATDLTIVDIYLIPVVYYNFIDEATLQPFNMSSPDGGIKVQVIFTDGNTTEYLLNGSVSPTAWFFNATQPVQKIRFLELYTTPNVLTIYRTIIAQEITTQNISVYLLDLRTTDVVVYTLQIFDLMSQYTNPITLVTKTINGVEQLITGDFADATGKITAYLINGNQYSIKVLSDNQPTRIIGSFYSDSTTAGLVYIRLFEIVGVPITQSAGVPISYSTTLLNLSGTPTIYSTYNSTVEGVVQLVQWYLYNGTSDTDPLLIASTSTTKDGIFTYAVPAGTLGTTNYFVKMLINVNCNNASLLNVTQCHTPIIYPKGLQLQITIPQPAQFDNPYTLKWIIFSFLLIVALSLNYKTASIGSLLLVGLAGFLAMIGWFSVGVTEGGVYVVLGLAILVALVQQFNKGSQR